MPPQVRKRSKKAGLPSGTMVYTGDRKDAKTIIHIIDYDEANFIETELDSVEACIPYKNKPTVTWVNVDGVHDVALLEKLGECFGLHKLVMEDIVNIDQRPKAEDFGDYLYVVLKMLTSNKAGETITEQISIIVGANFILSFQEGIEGT